LGEERYIFSAEKQKEADLIRWLRLQESIVDPVTVRHLETVGVAERWRCLEVGAGLGSIAQWLSKRVGPVGKVVATDIDTRFLQGIGAPNLEVRRHDILKDDLEEGQYDLAHCRKLLHHLPDPEKAMKRMADAVRPGGWLLVEEDDWGSVLSAGVTNPSVVPFAAAMKAACDALRKGGLADYYFGRRVRSLVEGLGFVDAGQEGWTFIMRGGDPYARMYEEAWRTGTLPSIPEGTVTREQNESVQRVFMDPTYYPFSTLFCAWGRKPVSQGGGTTS
jgi:SAM-dependent methyltransferase